MSRVCVSEQIEPAAGHVLGVLGMTVVDACEACRNEPGTLAWCRVRNAVSKLRYALRALNDLAACTDGAAHFHIAMSNETRRTERWLEKIAAEFKLPAEPKP